MKITTIGGETIEIKEGAKIYEGMARIESRTDEGQMTIRLRGWYVDTAEEWERDNPVFDAYVPMIVFGKGIYYSDKPATARELLEMGPRIKEVEG